MVGIQLPGASRESYRSRLPHSSNHRTLTENIEHFSNDGYGSSDVGRQCLPVDRYATNTKLVSRRPIEEFRSNNDWTLLTAPYNLEWIHGFGGLRDLSGWKLIGLQQVGSRTIANLRGSDRAFEKGGFDDHGVGNGVVEQLEYREIQGDRVVDN